jgi:hypothetical protein
VNLGNSVNTIVIKDFFDEQTYQEILYFINNNIQYYPLLRDNNEFIRDYAHNHPFFKDIHYKLIDIASNFFNEKVKPSYCFLSMYKQNGICPLHIDRDQCRYTIDYLISSTQEKSWPIHIAQHMSDNQRAQHMLDDDGHPKTIDEINDRISKENFETFYLNSNDAVLYSGTHQWHYRSERLNGEANLIFFHFVPEGFDGPLD